MRTNIKRLQRRLMPGVKVCAVVKANAYSLGAVQVSNALEPYVDCFAVANISEAITLRASKISKPILLFGVCENFEKAIQHDITVSINSLREIRTLAKSLKSLKETDKCKIHIKVNTGLNRYGITTLWQLKSIIAIANACPQITVDGLYTHLAHNDDNLAEIDTALRKFTPFKTVMQNNFSKATIHAACSNNVNYLPAQFGMVRIGKLFYGGFDGYKTAIRIKSKITAIQNVRRGARVGYEGSFTASAPMTIGVVPCGYADLVHFNFSDTLSVIVDKKPCEILGRICMDSFMIDASELKNPIGKTVTIMSNQKGQTIMDICKNTNIIACDLLCGLDFSRTEVTYKK